MKNTGIIRPIDDLGRIVLPIEIRRSFRLDVHTQVEIYVDGTSIIIKKHLGSDCLYCENGTVNPDDSTFCKNCGRRMAFETTEK